MIEFYPLLSMAALVGLVVLAFGFSMAWPRVKPWADRWMATRKKAVCDQLAETDRQARIARTKAAIQRSLEAKARECMIKDPYLPAILESRIRYDDLPDGPRIPGKFGSTVLASGSVAPKPEQLDDDWFERTPATLRSGERPKE